jgi:hypothetical protein
LDLPLKFGNCIQALPENVAQRACAYRQDGQKHQNETTGHRFLTVSLALGLQLTLEMQKLLRQIRGGEQSSQRYITAKDENWKCALGSD